MIVRIILTSHTAKLNLEEGGDVVCTREFPVNNNLSVHLLGEIDALFQEINRDPLSIKRVEFSANECGFTTERIGQTVANTYNFAIQNAS